MSKVALRVYNREIEALVDQGHIDEAVAHCMHILKSFPKHLETYRLMGKAYLEGHRYADAADIFQRVLLAAPDDFVSHLGTSIVFDEQNDLPAAIWHMERAFEVNSTNGGVQGELRRLYSRRDGLEPTKIHLTRGALAHIYAKGGEYQQAITELMSVLADEPNRNDMKTLLARCYFMAGMKNEAVGICMDLLKQYPFSLDGNRIMVEILPGTSMAQGVEQYRRRIHALDPYAAASTASVFETASLPDTAVMLDRLDNNASLRPSDDWKMQSQQSAGPTSTDLIPAATDSGQIPDWMQSAGWGPSTGEAQESAAADLEPESDAPQAFPSANLAEAEFPDWLRAMAPPGAAAASAAAASASPAQPPAEEAADFDWLASLGAPASPAQPTPANAPVIDNPAQADASLDWLNDLAAPEESLPPQVADVPAPVASAPVVDDAPVDNSPLISLPVENAPVENVPMADTPAADAPVEAVPFDGMPDWMRGLNESAPAAGLDAAENVPDWLRGLAEPEPAAADVPAAVSQELPAPAAPASPAEPPTLVSSTPTPEPAPVMPLPPVTMDWIDSVSDTQPTLLKPSNKPSPEGDVSDWLKGLSAPQSAPEPAAAQDVPDWLNASSNDQTAPLAAGDENVPSWLKGLSTPEQTPEASGEPNVPEWLNAAGSQPESQAETQPVPPAAANESVPAWLRGLSTPESTPALPSDQQAQDWFAAPSAPADNSAAPAAPDAGVPAWLSAIPGPETTPAASSDGNVLDWLGVPSKSKPRQEPAPAEPAAPAADDESAPAWLSSFAEPVPAPAPDENIPAWLEDANQPPVSDESESDKSLRWLESLSRPGTVSTPPVTPSPAAEVTPATMPAAELPTVPVGQPEALSEVAKPDTQPEAAQPLADTQPMGRKAEPVIEVPAPEVSAADQADAFAWLDSLVAGHTTEPAAPNVPAAAVPSEPAVPAAPIASDAFVPPPLSELVTGPGTSDDEQEDALKWLESLAAKQGAKSDELLTDPSERSSAAPQWVTQTAPETAAPVAPAEPAVPAAPVASDAFVPPPLSELVTGPGTSDDEQEDALKWLESLAAKQGAKSDELLTDPSERSSAAPQWVTQTAPETAAPVAPAESAIPAAPVASDAFVPPPLSELVTGPGTSEDEQEDALKWLESLAAKQGAKSDELLTDPSERSSAAPQWVTQTAPETAAPVAPAESAIPAAPVASDAFVPPPLSELVTGPGTSEDEQEDALKWLESLAAKQGAKSDELLTDPSERSSAAPQWVTQTAPETAAPVAPAAPAVPAAPIASDAFVPPPLSELVTGPGTSEDEQEDALKWLESLAAKQGAKSDELLTDPSERSSAAPQWVTQTAPEPTVPAEPAPTPAAPEITPEAIPAAPTALQWVTRSAPEAAPVPEIPAPAAQPESQDDSLDWRQEYTVEAPSLLSSDEEPAAPAPEDALGWLNEYGTASAGGEPAPAAPVQNAAVQAPAPDETGQPAQPVQAEAPTLVQYVMPSINNPLDDSLDWRQEVNADEPSSTANQPGQPSQPPQDNMGWLGEYGGASVGAAEAEAAAKAAAEATLISADLDWLGDLTPPAQPVATPTQPEAAPPQPKAHFELPDAPEVSLGWLTRLERNDNVPAAPASPAVTAKPEDEDPLAWALEPMILPDEPAAEVPQDVSPVTPPVTPPAVVEDAPVSVMDTSPTRVSRPSQALPEELPAAETLPDWLTNSTGHDVSAPVEALPVDVQPALAETEALDEPVDESNADSVAEWLREADAAPATSPAEVMPWEIQPVEAESEPVVDEAVSQPASGTNLDAIPDWMRAIDQPDAAAPSDVMPWETQPAAVETEPVDEAVSAPASDASPDAIPDWMRAIDQPDGGATPADVMPWDVQPAAAETEPVVDEAVSAPASDASPDAIPDWMRAADMPDAAAPADVMPWEVQPAAGETEPVDEAVSPPASDASPDAIPDWMRAADMPDAAPADVMPWEVQPAAAETEPVDEAVSAPASDASPDAIPDWMRAADMPGASASSDAMPWEIQPAAAETEPVDEAVSAPDSSGTISEWMREADKPDVPAEVMPWELETADEAEPVKKPAGETTSAGDIADWLKSLDEPEPQGWDDEVDDQTPAAQGKAPSWLETLQTPARDEPVEQEDLPEWLKDNPEADEAQVPVQRSGWQPVPESLPESFSLEEETSSSGGLDELVFPHTSEPEPEAVTQIPTLARAPLSGNDREILLVQKARDLLALGGLDGAMSEYVKLIRKGKMLEEVIYDLQEAVYSHPVDVIVWQTLGDAYMRSNRLQEALDAYSKAEELLR